MSVSDFMKALNERRSSMGLPELPETDMTAKISELEQAHLQGITNPLNSPVLQEFEVDQVMGTISSDTTNPPVELQMTGEAAPERKPKLLSVGYDPASGQFILGWQSKDRETLGEFQALKAFDAHSGNDDVEILSAIQEAIGELFERGEVPTLGETIREATGMQLDAWLERQDNPYVLGSASKFWSPQEADPIEGIKNWAAATKTSSMLLDISVADSGSILPGLYQAPRGGIQFGSPGSPLTEEQEVQAIRDAYELAFGKDDDDD